MDLLKVMYAEALSIVMIALRVPSFRIIGSSDLRRFSIFTRLSFVLDLLRRDRSFFLYAAVCFG